ncbi:MAG: SMI1/KNR4 family protein [Planctomycetes bacterium]|nr:SMI1/KNR4 family protein [Planctomycetota bacterium]
MNVLFTDSGPTLTASDILSLEMELGAILPAEYRAFLLRTNGGRPKPNAIDVPEAPWRATPVRVFFGVRPNHPANSLVANRDLYRSRLHDGLIPIATDSFGNPVCIETRPATRGRIVLIDRQGSKLVEYPLARSLTEFLRKLRPPDEV